MRMLLNIFLLFFIIVSCDSKQNNGKNIKAVTINDSVVLEKNVANNQAPICLDHLIEIIQSNSKCQELIGYMKNQNVKYGFQVDSFPVLSRTYPQDSLMHYELTLIENHPTHIHNAAMFRFSPYFKKLYIMDVVEADYIETDCDMKLIDSYKKNCWN
ncbi:hypothetical protein [Flavobacterium sp. I3-2]|uniref:hypothetical protein n=1 Tax=Flavobacterium sp. I3-2 TaxID=2748319 RepID=UPI0015AFF005|nr:hypothetical protein [Flavobacterium sp. I3-2]